MQYSVSSLNELAGGEGETLARKWKAAAQLPPCKTTAAIFMYIYSTLEITNLILKYNNRNTNNRTISKAKPI